MKIWKSILTCVPWLLIIALMVAHLGLIYQISADEMAEYATPEAPVLRETALGKVIQAQRMDVQEYVTLSGTFTSKTYDYMELSSKTSCRVEDRTLSVLQRSGGLTTEQDEAATLSYASLH